jgi:cytochrome c553
MSGKTPGSALAAMIVGGVGASILLAAAIGLVVIPISQARSLGLSPWAAICRAIGLTHSPSASGPASPAVSPVVFGPSFVERLAGANPATGAQIATATCSACHGDAGASTNPQFPVLAGQSAAAIYKQLRDYKAGVRVSPFMAPIVANLTDAQMVDLAAYFSREHAFGGLERRWAVPDDWAATLASSGDPARQLPACEACHDPNAGGPIESPRLWGQHQEYMLTQLQAFAGGARRNDSFGRMRDIAGKLTPAEQARLAEYYQGLR